MKKNKKELVPPVKVGQVIKAGVIGFHQNMSPVVKYKEYILFVKGTKKIIITELVKLRVTHVFPKFGFAKLER